MESLFPLNSDTSRLSETSFHVDNGLLQAEGSTPIINPLGGPVPQGFQKKLRKITQEASVKREAVVTANTWG